MTQSYDKCPYIQRKLEKKSKTPPKLRLHNDCGPTSVKPVYEIPNSLLTAIDVQSKGCTYNYV